MVWRYRPDGEVNRFDAVNKAIKENINLHQNSYGQWRIDRFQQLKELAYIADIELDRRKQRKRRKLEGW